MPSQYDDPPSPLSPVVHTSTPNSPARIGPYTDLALTTRNAQGELALSDQPAPKAPKNSQGDIRPVYSNDKKSNIENTAAATENVGVPEPPHSPNKWARGTVDGRRVSRDPYANQGMVGQSFFKNQGMGSGS